MICRTVLQDTNILSSYQKKIEKLLDSKIFDVVIGTRFLNSDNSMYEKMFNWSRLKTEQERSIPDGLLKSMDYTEDKYIYNCVNSSFIQRLCQLNDGEFPKHVFIVGADTDCCVLTTATAIFEYNIRPIVLTAYCDSNGGSESRKAGITCMKRLIGEKQLIEKRNQLYGGFRVNHLDWVSTQLRKNKQSSAILKYNKTLIWRYMIWRKLMDMVLKALFALLMM